LIKLSVFFNGYSATDVLFKAQKIIIKVYSWALSEKANQLLATKYY